MLEIGTYADLVLLSIIQMDYGNRCRFLLHARITPHPAYLALGATEKQRHAAYRALFRTELDAEAIADIRLALNQNQVLGNERFHRTIEKATGERREARSRGRPRKAGEAGGEIDGKQGTLGI